MSNEDSPYIWVPEVAQFASADDCMNNFTQCAAALVVSHTAYEAALTRANLADAHLESVILERDEARGENERNSTWWMECRELLTAERQKSAKYQRAIRVAQEFLNKVNSCHAEEAGLEIARILEEE